MDRNVDSIGSCSLDVDAESTDISDTSGSLNFPTPISIKDITREFTKNIKERCSVPTQTFVDSITGQVCTAVTHSSAITSSISVNNAVRNTAYPTVAVDTTGTATTSVLLSPRTPESFVSEKKPSYLNFGCCVNGYSNITTYDSKIRQDINKSREVSPIRPSTFALQYCKKSNSLALPIMLTMPKKNDAKTSPSRPTVVLDNDSSLEIGTDTRKQYHNNTNVSKLRSIPIVDDRTQELEKENSYNKLSFIEQRVERLYGPGALAQGWCIPKKKNITVQYENSGDDSTTSQALPTKSSVSALYATAGSSKNREELSSSKTLNVSTIMPSSDDDSDNSHSQEPQNQLSKTSLNNGGDYDKDTVLPKNTCNNYNLNLANSGNSVTIEVINGNVDNDELKTSSSITSAEECNDILISDKSDFTSSKISLANNNQVEKDGHYFLQQLKIQQERLLKLADNCDSYLSFLMGKSNRNEDVLGLLRSASGKARLLVSQKLNQFEGLCHSNLNNQPGDKFHTTADDLQGFWDMVYLQIDQLDAIFRKIEELKKNGWKSPEEQSSRFTPKNSENIVRNSSTNATENNFD